MSNLPKPEPSDKNDLERMRREYARRHQDTTQRGKYAPAYRPNQFLIQQRMQSVKQALAEAGLTSLHGKRILEVGCGSGGVPQEYLELKSRPCDAVWG